MTSRRKFLQAAGTGAAGLTLAPATGGLTLADQKPQDHYTRTTPFAGLKSLKAQARPISREERRARIEQARRLMVENHMDALMLMGGTSLVYFSSIHWYGDERLFALILPAQGEPFYVCPAFERDRALEQISLGPLAGNPDVRVWEEDESPYELVASGLKERG